MDISAYRQFLIDMMELQFWYVVQVIRKEGLSFFDAVNTRTEAYAYSRHYDPLISPEKNEPWRRVVDRLQALFHSAGEKQFPSGVWTILEKEFESRMAKDLKSAQESIAGSFAGFTYEFHAEYFGPPEPVWLTLHFRNYFAPDSPFTHRSEIVESLIRLIDEVRTQRPDVTHVQCASWLNNLEPFYTLFPPIWYETSVVCPLEGHAGWWGQFIDRSGQLHEKNVERFKATSEFRYPNRHGRCTMRAWLDHLKSQR